MGEGDVIGPFQKCCSTHLQRVSSFLAASVDSTSFSSPTLVPSSSPLRPLQSTAHHTRLLFAAVTVMKIKLLAAASAAFAATLTRVDAIRWTGNGSIIETTGTG